MNSIASSAPEIIAARLAAGTKNIRIGTGGVMMMHYSPLKLAEVFKTLSAFSPGRIDFGVGRAPGGDQNAVLAMLEGRHPMVDNMYKKFDTALKLINDQIPESSLYQEINALPYGISLPQAWMLGSSGNSAQQTARMGVGYSYAQFFTGEMSKAVFDTYKRNFQPSAFMEKPKINVAYMVTTAETREEAEYEARPNDLVNLWGRKGYVGQAVTPEKAKDYSLTEMDRSIIQQLRKQHLVGSIQEVAATLQAEQEKYGFDEAMIISHPHSQENGESKGKDFLLLRVETDHRWSERWSFLRFISKIETNRLTTAVIKPTIAAVRTFTKKRTDSAS